MLRYLTTKNLFTLKRTVKLVKLLSGANKAVTGEEPELYTTGGGTYARKLGGKVLHLALLLKMMS